MKKLLLLFAMVLSLNLANKASAQVYGSISFNTFYNELSPYGRWVNDIDYGQVWIADAPGFEPYYNDGHWTYTNYGWTWVSDYPWGWAPFHYGRWAYLPAWGWAWVPGYLWGPAWVSWCQNDGYFGWAPLGPGFGYYRSFNAVPHRYWRFVQQQYITGAELGERIVRPDRNPNLFRNASFINNREVHDNVTYNIGPRREAVERITRQRIATRPVAFTGTDEKPTRVPATTGNTDQQQVRIYRPELKPGQTAGNNSNAPQPGAAIEPNRLPKNNAVTKGEAMQQPVNNRPPVTDGDSRPVRTLPADRVHEDKNWQDHQQLDDRRRIMIEKQQAAQAAQNNDQRPVQNNQLNIDRQQVQDEQRRQDQLKQQQDLERRQQQAQIEQQRREQQLQQQQQANELRQQRAQQEEQQRREQQLQQQQRDNEIRQQQQDQQRRQQQLEQRQRQLEERRQQNEQRQNDLQQQRMQQRDNWQRPNEQRPSRSFERPSPGKKIS